MYKEWTEEEIKILKDNYATLSREELIYLLPSRTWIAIQIKASKIKLTWPMVEQRFWKYVDKKSNNECWNWIGACCRGYGLIRINRKNILSHRFSWGIHFGRIPEGLCVLHECDNRRCVNPNHLFLGTNQDNVDDKVNKNR